MSDLKTARETFLKAKEALRNKIDSDEVRAQLHTAKVASSRNVEGMLVDGLEHGVFLSGATLPPKQEEVVVAFLKQHAPKELEDYQQAVAAYEGAAKERSGQFMERVQKAVGNSVEPSRLSHHFANLDDEKAMALGAAIQAASGDLNPLIAARNEAQTGIEDRVSALKASIVEKGLLPEGRAQELAEDVLKQLEVRATSQQQKVTAKSA